MYDMQASRQMLSDEAQLLKQVEPVPIVPFYSGRLVNVLLLNNAVSFNI